MELIISILRLLRGKSSSQINHTIVNKGGSAMAELVERYLLEIGFEFRSLIDICLHFCTIPLMYGYQLLSIKRGWVSYISKRSK